MQCYVCAERGIERPAVGLCRSCHVGLCLEHLRDTAAHLSRNFLTGCNHDTWDAVHAAHPHRVNQPATHHAAA